MLLKCCTQYASKFGKFSSVHRTGKGQFSFQSQRRAMPKNVPTTTMLISHASKVMLKILQARLQQYMNWELSDYKLGFEEAEERDQIATFIRSWRKPISSRNYAKALDCVDNNKLLKILQEMGVLDHLICLLRNIYVSKEVTEPDMKQWTGSNCERSTIRL